LPDLGALGNDPSNADHLICTVLDRRLDGTFIVGLVAEVIQGCTLARSVK
jgi:hypothetical protein